MPDLSLNIIGNNLAGDAIKGVAGSLKGMADATVQFGFDAAKAYANTQRALAQLERVAHGATDVFAEQASQMQATLGVSDDMVLGLQKLALTFGAAQTQVEPTTRAILDYAAATGKDATTAMEMLLRGVESGTGELKKMGVTYDATGDKSKDLALATEALTKKFGGAAAADAKTLVGQLRIAEEGLGDLKKGFGGLITEAIEASGALTVVNTALEKLAYFTSAEKKDLDEVVARQEAVNKLIGQRTLIQEALNAGISKTRGGAGVSEDEARLQLRIIDMQLKGLEMQKEAREKKMVTPELSSVGTHELTAAASAAAAAAKEKEIKSLQELQAEVDKYARERLAREKATQDEIAQARAAAADEAALALAEVHVEQRKAYAQQEAALKSMRASIDEVIVDGRNGIFEDIEQEFEAGGQDLEKKAEAMGMAIGAALVNSLASELSQLAAGGEFDVASFFGDLLSTIGSVVGTVVGAINPLAGAAIGGLSNIAGSAIKGAGKKKHDGGWMERFHSGGWPGIGTDEIPAVLQEGERVLSRGEVGRMGGPAGVDAAARGGGGAGTVINVSVVDGENFRQFVEGKGGRAIYNATRTGHGMLAPMLGGG